ncbi:MAG: VWA domain-containing protein [Planctomycetes bacterium]|nr:VWA domain-containing protein [Planctomycetota bacterium]
MFKSYRRIAFLVLAGIVFLGVDLFAHDTHVSHITARPLADNIIMPQSRRIAFAHDRRQAVVITEASALIDIIESTATTTIEIRLQNKTNRRQEAELIIPVPDGAVVKGFAYDGPNGDITAKILEKEEAKRIYRSLVSKIIDPALVEFIGYNLIQSSVFPVEARGKQKIRITYEHLLETDGGRVDYILPRSESLNYSVPWKITANIKSKRGISTVYSPSHKIKTTRLDLRSIHDSPNPGKNFAMVTVAPEEGKKPGAFRLSYMMAKKGVTASIFSYPDSKVGGGYFLLLAAVPERSKDTENAIKRELTLVIDRSGSMRGKKLAQVKEAAMQVIAGLKMGESFNVILYSNNVESFSPRPVKKTKESEAKAERYIESITAMGGTNIAAALSKALGQKPTKNTLPIVLFLTDGIPTVGQTSEVEIGKIITKSNPYERRVFTFGVGVDVNAPLLEKIAAKSKAKSEFILPDEDVEVKVGKVFRRLNGPALANAKLEVLGADGKPAIGRTRDVVPDTLGDLFAGDQLVVLGQYVGTEKMAFRLTGNDGVKNRKFKFKFNSAKANLKNGFVPRLWASRKIAELIEIVRQMGADSKVSKNDPRVKELTDEIIRLSTEFGILTEYTAFLAREGTELHDVHAIRRQTGANLERRAMRSRSGRSAVNQSVNFKAMKSAEGLNYRNDFYDANMNRVSVANVQQINDRAYYRKNNRWIDSRLVNKKQSQIKPDNVIEFGTDEFFKFTYRLAKQNRQGSIAVRGDVVLLVDGKTWLIKMPR